MRKSVTRLGKFMKKLLFYLTKMLPVTWAFILYQENHIDKAVFWLLIAILYHIMIIDERLIASADKPYELIREILEEAKKRFCK